MSGIREEPQGVRVEAGAGFYCYKQQIKYDTGDEDTAQCSRNGMMVMMVVMCMSV